MASLIPTSKKTASCITILIALCLVSASHGQTKRFHGGLTAGIGLPMIPVSQWRSPISITGTVNVGVRLAPFLMTQINGGGLHTFSLGTIDSRTGKLRFDLIWATLDLGLRLRGSFRNETFFVAGGGDFYLSQQFDQSIIKQHTPGICLGLIHWTHLRRISSVVEVKWFFLFEPRPHPQVATLTIGILI